MSRQRGQGVDGHHHGELGGRSAAPHDAHLRPITRAAAQDDFIDQTAQECLTVLSTRCRICPEGWEALNEVRRIGAETERASITDNYIGKVLAHAPPDPDGAWPHRAVRDEIERLASEEIERAIQIERYNMRGVHGRGVYEGGDQERDLANMNYQAAGLSSAWPRTAALLQAIAKTWEEEAKRVDIEAAQRRMRS